LMATSYRRLSTLLLKKITLALSNCRRSNRFSRCPSSYSVQWSLSRVRFPMGIFIFFFFRRNLVDIFLKTFKQSALDMADRYLLSRLRSCLPCQFICHWRRIHAFSSRLDFYFRDWAWPHGSLILSMGLCNQEIKPCRHCPHFL